MSKQSIDMKIKPLYDRVLVLPVEPDKTTKSGLIIPHSAQGNEPIIQAHVVSYGAGVENLKEGMRVAYPNGSGMEISIDDVDHQILREKDLIMVIEE